MHVTPVRIECGFLDNELKIYPAVWPGSTAAVQPGDLSLFAPHGSGFSNYQRRECADPFNAAPPEEAEGGVVYFGTDMATTDFDGMMNVLGVQHPYWKVIPKDFAIFLKESTDPGKDGYLKQMRLVSKFALRCAYGVINDEEYGSFPEQKHTMLEAISLFMNREAERWGTSFCQDREKGLAGLFGGDGDYAREQLSFGFMVENSYFQIYRIWSRAWLVTK